MAEKSSRSKKKSKDYSSDSSDDDDIEAYVNREMSRAMKTVNKAMKESKLARKEGRKAQKYAYQDIHEGGKGKDFKCQFEGASAWSEKAGKYTQINTVNHMGTMINIQNAQNVQVGNNNLMVVTDKKLHQRKSSRSSDTTEDRQKEEEKRRQAEIEERFKDVIESNRPATTEDFTKACTHVTNWRRFLRNIDLHDGEIEQLYLDFHAEGVREVLVQGLLLWKQKSPREATLGAFAKTLTKLNQFDAIEQLKINYLAGKQTCV